MYTCTLMLRLYHLFSMQLTEAILHTGILKYSEHMESIEKQLKSLQTGHTHTNSNEKSPNLLYTKLQSL